MLREWVEKTVMGLGLELVELERSAHGLLRVTIDHPWQPGQAEQPVTLDDCERVTRQLQYGLEVEGVEYRRLEVSSPGIDRPLRHERDLERFCGAEVDVTLRQPMGAGAGVAANRKRFRGTLQRAAQGQGGSWCLMWSDAPAPDKPGTRRSRKAAPVVEQVLVFEWAELREARLAPVVNFKGRGSSPRAADANPNAEAGA